MSRKHVSLYIDQQALADAKRLLGTSTMTETVHRALEESIALQRRRAELQAATPEPDSA